ncbi:hypothetical protein FE257_000006 [Aspergillus nanangensis]|uniref:Uncharacterized protein n=1 Tax=Aspergillus nanangensis TaxID=2582783 RepID=A0AAD4CYP2_ASPNN|nr:hypothetical protein FE257_000006 [Aspergillus nanangensis]
MHMLHSIAIALNISTWAAAEWLDACGNTCDIVYACIGIAFDFIPWNYDCVKMGLTCEYFGLQ